jgi:hypothetical protein
MGIFVRAKIKSIDPTYLPEWWTDEEDVFLEEGKLVRKPQPMVQKKTIKPVIFIKHE